MDSLKKATELQNLSRILEWVIPELKGVDKDGKKRSSCSCRKLEIRNVTEIVTHPQSAHPSTFRLTAEYRGGDNRMKALNDHTFLNALAQAITKNLPALLDEATEIIHQQGWDAVKAAEVDLENTTRKLAALRRSPELQQELI